MISVCWGGNINTKRNNSEILVQADKEIGLEVNTDKTEYKHDPKP